MNSRDDGRISSEDAVKNIKMYMRSFDWEPGTRIDFSALEDSMVQVSLNAARVMYEFGLAIQELNDNPEFKRVLEELAKLKNELNEESE